jgi:hypothetical protein
MWLSVWFGVAGLVIILMGVCLGCCCAKYCCGKKNQVGNNLEYVNSNADYSNQHLSYNPSQDRSHEVNGTAHIELESVNS